VLEARNPYGSVSQSRVSSMSIPKGSIENAEWEVSFAMAGNKSLTVQMKGYEPLLAVADD